MRLLTRLLRNSTRGSQRGSALLLTLVLAGVLTLGIGIMLSSVSHLALSARQKISMEEAYQSAMSGLHMGRAWMADPVLAGTMLKPDPQSNLTNLILCAQDMSKAVIENKANVSFARKAPGTIVTDYFSGENGFNAENTVLADGRRVLFTFPENNDSVVKFYSQSKALASMTGSAGSNAVTAGVMNLRITTPYPPNSSGVYPAGAPWNQQPWIGETDGLREISLILESEGYSQSGTHQIRRVVQQKLLVFPEIEEVEGAKGPTFGHSIVAGGNVAVGAQINVHWGPVLVKGSMELLEMYGLDKDKKSIDVKKKFFGAGTAQTPEEFWVKYQASGLLTMQEKGKQVSIFPSSIEGVPVTDFYSQLYNGSFGSEWNMNSVKLTGNYVNAMPGEIKIDGYFNPEPDPKDPNTHTPPNALYTVHNGTAVMGQGALVQNMPSVAAAVDQVINNDMSYTYWKELAKAEGIYLKPKSGGGFTNEFNETLYVQPNGDVSTTVNTKPLTMLSQISMKPLVPVDKTNGGETENIQDRWLFVDTPQGTENGTKLTYDFNASDNWFWKGMMYINGNVTSSGGGAMPVVKGRDPNQYAAFYHGNNTLGSTPIENCMVRGVLYASGTVSRTGNIAVYGTMVAKGGVVGSGGPDVWYDLRNRWGLGSQPTGETLPTNFQITGGPIAELGAWPAGA